MTSASARSSSEHRGEAGNGPFMLTLCRLAQPVTIRPPQAPHLKPFKFFTTRARQRDGSEHLYLHMGFFETLAYAQKWQRAVRSRHPGAIATAAPPAFLQRFDPVDNQSLTDTQVLNILETRQPGPAHGDTDSSGSEQIELIRPDDTGTRLALKEAVVRGMPVSFALQLQWSARPIELSRVPELPIFKSYALYVVESRNGGRSCFFLRLGFFGDPVSAKQVAAHLRSSFASAAVVPVLDEEIANAREACTDTSLIPCLLRERLEHAEPESSLRPEPSRGSEKPRRREASESSGSLEQTLAQLAEREMWSDPDFLSDTGVRHLKVEVQKLTSGGRH
jgi:hypothetical protein